MKLSIVIPTYNEGGNILPLIRKIREVIPKRIKYEILVVDGHSKDNTRENALLGRAKVIVQKAKGFGGALREGFAKAKGEYVITLDSDFSHDPKFMLDFIKNAGTADVLIASRYIEHGTAKLPFYRRLLSKFLNNTFAMILSMPFKDMSSGYRMYKKEVLNEIVTTGTDFNVLQEILIQAYSRGFKIKEIPFNFEERKEGKSKLKLLQFGISYSKTLYNLWRLRNSATAVDYDARAYNSIILLQRYWQRKRYQIVMGMIEKGKKVLDIGSGSSKIIQNLQNATALDISKAKLRFLKNNYGINTVNASVSKIPFKNETFDTVIFSNVIEHLEKSVDALALKEIRRVLKKKGVLIIATPNYGLFVWPLVEFFYSRILSEGYAKEHINPYTLHGLKQRLAREGFRVLGKKEILRAEVILKCQKEQ